MVRRKERGPLFHRPCHVLVYLHSYGLFPLSRSGLRYTFGMFEQRLDTQGQQIEFPDAWLSRPAQSPDGTPGPVDSSW